MPERQRVGPLVPDVRMRGFATRVSVAHAWNWVDEVTAVCPREFVDIASACGRVLAEDITAARNVPDFRRSMMDGFALHAADTFGSSAYAPMRLKVVGSALPGVPYLGTIQRGEAVEIMTGAPVPHDADAVLPFESTDGAAEGWVMAIDSVPPQKNVGVPGEDIAQGNLVLRQGRRLRPQDIGVASSIGMTKLPVIGSPRVRLVITGNELLPAGTMPRDYSIADANGPMLQALVIRDGGMVLPGSLATVADSPKSIRKAIEDDADVVIVSGGSSVGREDHAPQVLAEMGELALHGIAMRPSSPTGMGRVGSKIVFLLPGNPVSCLCAYDFFAGRSIRKLAGRPCNWPYPLRSLPLMSKLSSVVGRCDYARVVIDQDKVVPIGVAGASILSSTTRADGFVVIPEASEGYPAGDCVDVYLYD